MLHRGQAGRLRVAELTSGVGALVLGIGIGALLAEQVGQLGFALLLAGGLAHGWGMFAKHRIERSGDRAQVWWEPVAYWTCWVLLAGGALAVGGRLLGLF